MQKSLPPDTSGQNDKKALRQRLLRWRTGMDAADKAQRDAVLCDQVWAWLLEGVAADEALTVALYAPIRAEPDLLPLAERIWGRSGGRVVLPQVVAPDQALRFRQWLPGASLRPAAFGVLEADGPELRPDAVVIPCVGFNADGFRLGYGGGFYDRTLATWQPPPRTLGVAYREAIVTAADGFEPASWDQPLQCVLAV